LTGVRAAALAGLAITPLPASALIAGLRILGVEEGLPPLPDLEFAVYEKARPNKAAARNLFVERATVPDGLPAWA
jgi:DNA-binding transcriptional LysR family regulator